MSATRPLRVAFIHPDLGIGGAERLVVDAALGLQARGHSVDIYTSHHDPGHCFEETKNGSLNVHYVVPPLPRSLGGKFHILFAHLRQLHLTTHLLRPNAPSYDVYFVDQLSTCVPFLRQLGKTRVVFYCHFPDKLLANGAFVEGKMVMNNSSLLKRLYRLPMDWLEEVTTRQADIILANSKFTARVFKAYFESISQTPQVVYPGINISVYETEVDLSDQEIVAVASDRPTLLSLNRFEKKKNAALAIEAFAGMKSKLPSHSKSQNMRLILAGGYDPRLEDNMLTLYSLIDLAKSLSLTYNVITPASSKSQVKIPPLNMTRENPEVLFLLNFTTSQRTALLSSSSTKALLYTPANEHFGIGPVEGMVCGVPVLACDSGGPTESVLDQPKNERTGWLRTPNKDLWADALVEIVSMGDDEREALSDRAKARARALFGMDAMAAGLEDALITAVGMGNVSFGIAVWWIMLLGFAIAYITGPLVWPSSVPS
ncbi:alpha-1,3-mannosyltransferase ALG2 [Collybia nuda]|uniref:Alpha-1,3/1,6-mannosyltransferase ALG2 n=1 Tax=Collybia nuda TaxID=64659 RepID=A0A9P5XYW1_9AGAR|nr:alpha-1,3-mannosyltransferase ALG2 [Collybia nuda]